MNKNKNSAFHSPFTSHNCYQLGILLLPTVKQRPPCALPRSSLSLTIITLCSGYLVHLPFKPFLNSLFLNTSFLIIPAFKYTQNRLESKQGYFGLVVPFSYAVCSPFCCQTYLRECFPLPLLHSPLSLPQHTADAIPSAISHFWCHDFSAMRAKTPTEPSLRCLCQILCK